MPFKKAFPVSVSATFSEAASTELYALLYGLSDSCGQQHNSAKMVHSRSLGWCEPLGRVDREWILDEPLGRVDPGRSEPLGRVGREWILDEPLGRVGL
jgi:hypothetical protein